VTTRSSASGPAWRSRTWQSTRATPSGLRSPSSPKRSPAASRRKRERDRRDDRHSQVPAANSIASRAARTARFGTTRYLAGGGASARPDDRACACQGPRDTAAVERTHAGRKAGELVVSKRAPRRIRWSPMRSGCQGAWVEVIVWLVARGADEIPFELGVATGLVFERP
jgi:hypothetical protein